MTPKLIPSIDIAVIGHSRAVVEPASSARSPVLILSLAGKRFRLDAHTNCIPPPLVLKGRQNHLRSVFGGESENELHSVDDYFRRQTNESG